MSADTIPGMASRSGLEDSKVKSMAEDAGTLFESMLAPMLTDLEELQKHDDPRVVLVRLLYLYQASHAVSQVGEMLLVMVAKEIAPEMGLDAMRSALQANVDPMVEKLTQQVADFAVSKGKA